MNLKQSTETYRDRQQRLYFTQVCCWADTGSIVFLSACERKQHIRCCNVPMDSCSSRQRGISQFVHDGRGNVCVMAAMGVHLFYNAFNCRDRHLYEHFFVVVRLWWSLLTIRKTMLVWFVPVMLCCVSKHPKNSDKDTFSDVQQNPTWTFFSLIALFPALCK